MDSFLEFINNGTHIDYAIVDISGIKSLKVDSSVFEGIKLIDIFQNLNSEYLFLKTNPVLLPSIFSIYQESCYEFQHIVPWVKVNFDEVTIIDLTSRFRGLIDYFVIFQKPGVRPIKSKLKSLIIEEDLITTINGCEKDLISGLDELNLSGIYVASDGMFDLSSDIVNSKPKNTRAELF